MNVDRSTFLKLVSAIAAAPYATSACGTPPEPVVAVPVDIKPMTDASTPPIVIGAPPPSPAGTSRPPIDDESVAPIAAGGGIWDLPYDPAAPPKSCSMLKCGGPVKEGMTALRSQCRQLEGTLKPEAFQRFLGCMLARNNTPDTCDLARVGTQPGECLEKWSSPPTVDPATVAKCKPIVAACAGPNRSIHASGPLSMQTCQAIFSVTTPRSDRKMIHCVTEYCEESKDLCYMANMY